VAAPNGKKEAPLREWITGRGDRGAHLLGVCNGARLLAATGLLDGRRATAHWSSSRGLERNRPQVDWVRGQRYIQDGTLTTTAGVTSGVFGALRLVEQLAGAGEGPTGRPGDRLPGLVAARPHRDPRAALGARRSDVSAGRGLPVVAPNGRCRTGRWGRRAGGRRPVRGLRQLVRGPDVAIAAEATVTTRHGLRLVATPANAGGLRIDRLVVPGVGRTEEVEARLLGWAAARGLNIELPNAEQAAGQFSFDAMLGDLAGHSDQTTARVTAKSLEYPTEQLELAGAGWPWRPTALLALTASAALGVALLPAAATRRNRR
jgi:hypothetical protein